MLTLSFLQHYWWAVISLLAALLVFLMFVQGGQSMLFYFREEGQKKLIVNALGRKWEFTFTTLVTFGGAFFAAFPLFYASSFGGAYALWMVILFCFVIQAVSYEFRSKPNNLLGKKTFDTFLWINGFVGVFFIGIAISTFFTGAPFIINRSNILQVDSVSSMAVVTWQSKWHGLEALGSIYSILFALALVAWTKMLGLLYIIQSIKDESIYQKSRKHLVYLFVIFLVCILASVFWILTKSGFTWNAQTGEILIEEYKYLHNFLAMPFLTVGFLLGVVGIVFGVLKTLITSHYLKGIWFAGIGTILVVFCLVMNIGYHQTAYYPSTVEPLSSLTIANSSSALFTLKVMFYASLFIPLIAAYIWYAWRSISKKPIDLENIKEEEHPY